MNQNRISSQTEKKSAHYSAPDTFSSCPVLTPSTGQSYQAGASTSGAQGFSKGHQPQFSLIGPQEGQQQLLRRQDHSPAWPYRTYTRLPVVNFVKVSQEVWTFGDISPGLAELRRSLQQPEHSAASLDHISSFAQGKIERIGIAGS